MKLRLPSPLLSVLFFVSLWIVYSAPSAIAQHTHHNSPKTESASDNNSYTLDKESLEALYWARLDSAKMRFSKEEVRFMTMMIPHHAQALIMSDLAPKNGASPIVQTLASRIINAQRDEIRLMQTWLSDRKQPYPEIGVEGLDLVITMAYPEMEHAGHGVDVDPSIHENHEDMDHSAHHAEDGEHGNMDHSDHDDHAEMHHSEDGEMDHSNHESMEHGEMSHQDMDHDMMDHSTMVGMLSPAQMKELSEAKGVEFDRLFLKYMIQHHNGAVIMVTELFDSDGAGWDDTAYKIASDIQVEQRTEIARMGLMLEEIEKINPR